MIVKHDAHQNGRAARSDTANGDVVQFVRCPAPGWYGVLKGLVEVFLASILLVLSLPVIILACIAVKLTSRGPMFYCQTRLGRGAKPFNICKIRTMTHDCERHSGVCWATANDPRVTPVGRFLRRLHIDELPQLWNVMRGEMSLVGPRPERPEFLPELSKVIPRYRERLLVRPGVTGLAQIQLPADTNLDSVRRKLAYDVYYVEHMSFGLDWRILFCTGLFLLGLPFAVSRALFNIPNGDPVERAFTATPEQPVPIPEFNAV